jgi:hypothetical protein
MSAELKAGRELDAKVAVEVMGRRIKWRIDPCVRRTLWIADDSRKAFGGEAAYAIAPEYSTDIAAAFQVVEHVKGMTGETRAVCVSMAYRCDTDEWAVQFYIWGASELLQSPHHAAPTLPEAICRAALWLFSEPEALSGLRPSEPREADK